MAVQLRGIGLLKLLWKAQLLHCATKPTSMHAGGRPVERTPFQYSPGDSESPELRNDIPHYASSRFFQSGNGCIQAMLKGSNLELLQTNNKQYEIAENSYFATHPLICMSSIFGKVTIKHNHSQAKRFKTQDIQEWSPQFWHVSNSFSNLLSMHPLRSASTLVL